MTEGTIGMHEDLTPARLVLLASLADVLLPRAEGMPSASDIDLVKAPLEKALRSRPDLIRPLCEILDSLGDKAPENAVAHLAAKRPQAFEVLMQAVAGAYYMDRRVRELLQYDGQRALILPRSGFGAEELLMELMESPPRYIDPDRPSAASNGTSTVDDK